MFLTFTLSQNSFAVPSQFTLLKPNSIERKQNSITVKVKVPCSNSDVLDWSRIVMSNDDSGDMTQAVGVLWPKSNCDKEGMTQGQTRTYSITEDYEFYSGETLEPMDVAK